MYKIKVILASVIILVCLVSIAGSQMNTADKSIGLFGNLNIPQNQNFFSDLYDNGYGYGLEYQKHLIKNTKLVFNFVQSTYSEKPEAMRDHYTDVMYRNTVASNPATTTVAIDSVVTTGGALAVQQFSLNVMQYLLTSGVNVYVTGGPGLYRYRYDEVENSAVRYLTDTTTGTTQEAAITYVTKGYVKYCLAIIGGLGFEFNLANRIAIFAEGKYNYVHYHRESGGAYRNFMTGVIGLRYGLDL
jgi:hypothetical protein